MEDTPHISHYHGQSVLYGDSISNHRLVRIFEARSFEDSALYSSIEKEVALQSHIQSQNLCPYRVSEVLHELTRIQRRYIPGVSLADQLTDQIISEEQFLLYAYSLSKAVRILHQNGIVAQNIKPENVIISQKGTPILVDFGISAITDDMLRSSQSLNSIILPCPESISARYPVWTTQTDIFQLGMLFYVMVNGSLPWTTINLTRIYSQLSNGKIPYPKDNFSQFSPEIQKLIEEMTKPSPAQRPSIDKVIETLKTIQQTSLKSSLNKRPTLQHTTSLKIDPHYLETLALGNIASIGNVGIRTKSKNRKDRESAPNLDSVIPSVGHPLKHQLSMSRTKTFSEFMNQDIL